MLKFFKNLLVCVFCLLGSLNVDAQDVKLKNPSFEGQPMKGTNTFVLDDWQDCGAILFPGESAPDIHPAEDNSFWKNNIKPSDGGTYVGMVVRINETYESIIQKLDQPLKRDQCYYFSIDLVRSANYWSGVNPRGQDPEVINQLSGTAQQKTTVEHNYVEPIVLRIWGTNSFCGRTELLVESNPIKNVGWDKNYFKFKPTADYSYVVFEAFYKVPTPVPYLGHLLMDNASDFIAVDCSEKLKDVVVWVKEKKEKEEKVVVFKQEKKEKEEEVTEVFVRPTKKEEKEETVVFTRPKAKHDHKPKILLELDRSKIKEGQIILVSKLVFDTDASTLNKESTPVLDEIYSFLDANKNVELEFGGHTNGNCDTEFCDKLSKERAQSIADLMIKKGINKDRITVKGYGKRKQIASNKTPVGRKKNQRVEIKILKIGPE